MDAPHVMLKAANSSLVRPMMRLANKVIRPPKPIAVKLAGHKVYAQSLDRLLALFLHKFSSQERFELDCWKSLLKAGDHVLDIGANLGIYGLCSARIVGESGEVHCFEPDPNNSRLLKINIEANDYSAVIQAHSAAVADKDGRITLHTRPEHHGDHRIYAEEGGAKRIGIDVPLVCMDSKFSEGYRVDAIKLDIQGAEPLAIKGMKRLLAENPQCFLFLEYWPEGADGCHADLSEMLKMLQDLGFKLFHLNSSKSMIEETNLESLSKICEKEGYTNIVLYGPECKRQTANSC